MKGFFFHQGKVAAIIHFIWLTLSSGFLRLLSFTVNIKYRGKNPIATSIGMFYSFKQASMKSDILATKKCLLDKSQLYPEDEPRDEMFMTLNQLGFNCNELTKERKTKEYE